MDDVASTTNMVAVIFRLLKLRNYLCSSSLDEIRIQDSLSFNRFLTTFVFTRLFLCRKLLFCHQSVFLPMQSLGRFLFTLVDLSSYYLRLLFQLHCCLHASSELNNVCFVKNALRIGVVRPAQRLQTVV